MKSLKPPTCAVIEVYVGLPIRMHDGLGFVRPNPMSAAGDIVQVFKDTGFAIENDEDLTEEFLELARAGFRQLGEALAGARRSTPPARANSPGKRKPGACG